MFFLLSKAVFLDCLGHVSGSGFHLFGFSDFSLCDRLHRYVPLLVHLVGLTGCLVRSAGVGEEGDGDGSTLKQMNGLFGSFVALVVYRL